MRAVLLLIPVLVCASAAQAQDQDIFSAFERYWTERAERLGEPQTVTAFAQEVMPNCTLQMVVANRMANKYLSTLQSSEVLALVDEAKPEDRNIRTQIASVVLDEGQTLTAAGASLDEFPIDVANEVMLACYDGAVRSVWVPKN